MSWKVRTDKYGYGVPTAIEGEDGKAICQFTWTTHQGEKGKALWDNAYLLAAAPELQKRLRELCAAVRKGEYMDELLDAEHALNNIKPPRGKVKGDKQ